jgi:SAM-dependent methyltransferase
MTTPLGSETLSPSLRHATNYYGWIAEQFGPTLGHRVLDIGGGMGPLLDHVVGPAREITSIDLDPPAVEEIRQRFSADSRVSSRVANILEERDLLGLIESGFDSILCVNVLEHIQDDASALAAMLRILPPSGYLNLLVPAHPFLYGTPDELAGHFRRYRRKDLVKLAEAAGFDIRDAYFFNGFGALPYFLNARILKPKSLSGAVDTQIVLYDRYFVPVLRRLERRVRPPFGQSLIIVAQKP